MQGCLITSDLWENMPFLLQNLFLAIAMLISRKLVQISGISEKCGFFWLPAARHDYQRFKTIQGCTNELHYIFISLIFNQ